MSAPSSEEGLNALDNIIAENEKRGDWGALALFSEAFPTSLSTVDDSSVSPMIHQQPFASPEEALEHFGKKGMRWGVRNEEEPVGRDTSGRLTPTTKPVLSERKQKSVAKFQKRSDVMSTRISDLKRSNQELQGTKNLAKRYERFDNNQNIRILEKEKQRALRDAEAVEKGKLTSNQKKVVVGAVVVSAVLAAGVVYRGQQSGAFNSVALRGSAYLRGEKVPFNKNPALSKSMSANDLLNKVAKPVNPGYSKAGGKMNCRRSTYAYELRRRGFDVHATTSSEGWGQSESGVINALTPGSRNFYRMTSMSQVVVDTGESSRALGDYRKISKAIPGAKILLDKLDTGGPDGITPAFGSKKVFEALAKQPEGARGEVLFKFPQFGHSMAFEVVGGKPHIFDSQKGTYHDLTKTVEEKWGSFSGAEIRRLDNVDLDINFLTRWATNVGAKP